MEILIAEDDATSRLVLGRTLAKLGYGVLEATDGVEAVDLFVAHRPPVVITDWMMPRRDGLEVCRQVRRESGPDGYTYLIMLTALGGKRNYLEAMDAGADDFLTKPFDADELVTRLRVAERILIAEGTLRQLAALHDCCPDCHRMPDQGGAWKNLRQWLREQGPPRRAVRCPECLRRHPAPHAPLAVG